ncbi:hypothetical protein FQA47_004283 [Oryzias melastigma]|uniref:Immunoglobulin subtype domain-containing protein n=1 Tax=Oryzias melastigma TaxID=30732 RepID=A0A834CGN1_ORYME|nr:hypothetical protein FQA47_004283 [Oryzias melastigma]
MSRFITFLLLNCWVFTGILGNDEPEPVMHYVQKYQQVCLYVREPPPHKSPSWNFKNTVIANEEDTNPVYTNKAKINRDNWSLCINNISESDTGLYKFTHTIKFTIVTHIHQVIMEEEVPNPQVTVRSAQPSNQSALPCMVNVTCSIHNHLLVSYCGDESCEISQTFGNLNISIYVRHKTAVCSVKNHVSNNTSSKSLPAECFADDPKSKEGEKKTKTWRVMYSTIGFIIAALLCAAFIVACGIWKLRRLKITSSTPSQTIQSAPFEKDQRPEPRLSASSSNDAEHSYENLEDTPIREKSGPVEDQEVEKVDTVYNVPGAADEYIIPIEPQSTKETDC